MILIVWCMFLTIQIWITVSGSVSFFRYRVGSNTDYPKLSIIIAARNEDQNLIQLIPSLLKQEYPSFEIIVVLDRCTDKSKEVLEKFMNDRLSIIEIEQTPKNWNSKKFALNQGIKKSKGEWLVFTDADCLPNSDRWLTAVVKQIKPETKIIIGVSPYRLDTSLLSNYTSFEAFLTAFKYTTRTLKKKPYMAVGRNLAIKKSFFIESGGYQGIEHITGGDDDLFIQKNATKHNTEIVLGSNSIVFTEPEKSWNKYFKQKIRHLSVGSRYKSRDLFYLSIDQISLFAIWILVPFVATHAFFLPLLLFYLFIKLVGYRFAASKMGVNINYMLLPLVDMLYALLTPMLAMWSKLVKDIQWKN